MLKILPLSLIFLLACDFSGSKSREENNETKNDDTAVDEGSKTSSVKVLVSSTNENRAVIKGSISLATFFGSPSLKLSNAETCSAWSTQLSLKPSDGGVESNCVHDVIDFSVTAVYDQPYTLLITLSNPNTSISGSLDIPPMSTGFTGNETLDFTVQPAITTETVMPVSTSSVAVSAGIWCCEAVGQATEHCIQQKGFPWICKVYGNCPHESSASAHGTPPTTGTLPPTVTFQPPPIQTFTPVFTPPPVTPVFTPPAPVQSQTPGPSHDHATAINLSSGHWCIATASFYQPFNPVGSTTVQMSSRFDGAWPDVSSNCQSKLNEYRSQTGYLSDTANCACCD